MSAKAINGANHLYFCYASFFKMHKNSLRALLTCFIIILALQGCDNVSNPLSNNGPVKLAFNFKTDSSYLYIMDSRLLLMPEVNGKTLSIKQEMKLLSTYKVTSNTNNQKDLTVTYTRITMSSGNGVVSKDFDSDDTANKDPLFLPIAAMINKPFNIIISDKGVSGTQQLYAYDMTDSTALTNNNNFSDSSLRKMMMQCLNIYPPGEVKTGDSWKRTYNTSTGFINMKLENTYTLKHIDKGIAYIELHSIISPESATQAMAFSGIQNGTIEVEIESGLIFNSRISQQLKGKILIGEKENPVTANSEINIYGSKQQ